MDFPGNIPAASTKVLKQMTYPLLAGLVWIAMVGGDSAVRAAPGEAAAIDADELQVRLREKLIARAKAEVDATRLANGGWEKIDRIERKRDEVLVRYADILHTIQTGLTEDPEPVLTEAIQRLDMDGIEAAITYLEGERPRLLKAAAEAGTKEADAQLSLLVRVNKLRPLLLQAQLQQANLAPEVALRLLQQIKEQAPDWWNVRNELGNLLHIMKRVPEAEKELQQAQQLAVDGKERAMALRNLGVLLMEANRLKEAEAKLKGALEAFTIAYGENHATVAGTLNDLGLLLMADKRNGEAEPMQRRALKIDEACFGKEDFHVARDLNNLSQSLMDLGRFIEAQEVLRRSLELMVKIRGADHPQTAIVLGTAGNLYMAAGRLADAESLMRRSLQILEKSHNGKHPHVSTVVLNLATLLQNSNRPAEAEPLLRRALKFDEELHGKSDQKVAITLNNLAQVLQDLGRLQEAEPFMRRSLQIQESIHGKDHYNVASELSNLAMLLQDTDRLTEAEPLFRRALEVAMIYRKKQGREHPLYQDFENNFRFALKEKGLSLPEINEQVRQVREGLDKGTP